MGQVRDFFKPKPGSILSRNNMLHGTWGMAVVGLGRAFGGGSGATVGLIGIAVLGAGWEALNTRWPRGNHRHFDYKGLLSFVVPAVIARVLVHFTGIN